ncbi:MAG: hypothetical protein GY704_00685, partial [Phycisphaeraceae bacterium]|nr:hypothetical protein [Phycisphaeraceae bacterium]
MDETNERIDLGVWDHDDAREGDQEDPLEGQPKGAYRLYAERIVEEPLNERMAERFHAVGPSGTERRMQAFSDERGLVERPKRPDPIDVPECVGT